MTSLIFRALDKHVIGQHKAKRAVARFMSLHPHNLAQKSEIIVEHFREVRLAEFATLRGLDASHEPGRTGVRADDARVKFSCHRGCPVRRQSRRRWLDWPRIFAPW